MSVINKMLRDLDSREAPAFARGTATVNPLAQTRASASRHSFVAKVAAAGVLAALCAGIWLYLGGTQPNASAGRTPVVSVKENAGPKLATTATTPAAALPGAASSIATSPVAPVNAVPPADTQTGMVLKMDTQASLAARVLQSAPPVAATKPPASAAPEPTALAVVTPATTEAAQVRKSSPPLSTASPPSATTATTTPVIAAPTTAGLSTSVAVAVAPTLAAQRQAAAADAMAQAQALWNAGSRDAALDLMREAVEVAERGASSGSTGVLVPLVRELARMELAQGQATRVLELLTRLELAMGGQADLWAVRGNAAQRLGRHQESANAYLQALRLRPDEPRWMLGAAVSLAAQGQVAAAAELAEKARAGGAVSREVATYLRQLGVPLRE